MPGDDGTRKTPLIRRCLVKRPRFHSQLIPTSASWINIVERWFALLSESETKRGSHRSTAEPEAAILDFIATHTEEPKSLEWTTTV